MKDFVSTSKREFNFSIYPQRRIALFFLYFGWDFDGLVVQSDTKNTVEEVYIFNNKFNFNFYSIYFLHY